MLPGRVSKAPENVALKLNRFERLVLLVEPLIILSVQLVLVEALLLLANILLEAHVANVLAVQILSNFVQLPCTLEPGNLTLIAEVRTKLARLFRHALRLKPRLLVCLLGLKILLRSQLLDTQPALIVRLITGQLILHTKLRGLERLFLRHAKSLEVPCSILHRSLLTVSKVLHIHLLNLP